MDEERDIKKKKQLAYKEEIAKAKRAFLEDTKNKYYDEIKLRTRNSRIKKNKKALTFSIDTTKNKSKVKQIHDKFENNTKELFLNEKILKVSILTLVKNF